MIPESGPWKNSNKRYSSWKTPKLGSIELINWAFFSNATPKSSESSSDDFLYRLSYNTHPPIWRLGDPAFNDHLRTQKTPFDSEISATSDMPSRMCESFCTPHAHLSAGAGEPNVVNPAAINIAWLGLMQPLENGVAAVACWGWFGSGYY